VLIPLPVGIDDGRVARRRAPVLAWIVLAVALLLFASERLLPYLPAWLYGPATAIGYLALQSDPAGAPFAAWQLWSYPLLSGGTARLLLDLLLWCLLATQLERQLGSPYVLLCLLLLAPLGLALPLLNGLPVPRVGFAPLITALGGMLFALLPQLRLRLLIWGWAITHVGRWRAAIGLGPIVGAYLVCHLTILMLSDWPGESSSPTPAAFYPLYSGNLLGMLIVGFLLGLSLRVLRNDPGQRPSPLGELAAGDRPLHELEAVLASASELPMAELDAVAERCRREHDHEHGRLLAGYLALRAPDSPAHRHLQAWLDDEGHTAG